MSDCWEKLRTNVHSHATAYFIYRYLGRKVLRKLGKIIKKSYKIQMGGLLYHSCVKIEKNQTTIILTSHHQTWSDLVINFPHVIFKTPQWNIQDGGRAAWRQRWKTPIFLFANTYTPLAFVVAFNVFFSKRVELSSILTPRNAH